MGIPAEFYQILNGLETDQLSDWPVVVQTYNVIQNIIQNSCHNLRRAGAAGVGKIGCSGSSSISNSVDLLTICSENYV